MKKLITTVLCSAVAGLTIFSAPKIAGQTYAQSQYAYTTVSTQSSNISYADEIDKMVETGTFDSSSLTKEQIALINKKYGEDPQAIQELQKKSDSIKNPSLASIDTSIYAHDAQFKGYDIINGIDISRWQGNIDWKQVKKSDIDFAFVRISYGLTHEDYTYDENMTNAELAGVPTGTYVYSTALSTTTALKEAQLAISKMQGYKVSYPVVYDLEYAKASKLSAKTVSEMALTFCNEVRRAGYYPMVYCNTNWYDNYIDWSLLSGVDVWIARYGDTIQAPDKERYNYTIWQSTDGNRESGLNSTSGLVAGIPAGNDVDMDFGYVDYTCLLYTSPSPRDCS